MQQAEKLFQDRIQRRGEIALFFLALCFVGLIGRLFWVQCYSQQNYHQAALKQHWKKKELPATRESLRDREGSLLAVTIEGHSCYADPLRIKDAPATARKLARILDLSQSDILSRITNKKRRFVWLERLLEQEQVTQISSLNLKGIGLRQEPKRVYPHASLAAHVLGFVGLDHRGLGGIEYSFEKELTGQSGYVWRLVDGRLARAPIYSVKGASQQPINGADVFLTLDLPIQSIVEQELAELVTKFQPKNASAVLIAVKTGEVVAMASWPTFDPNHYGDSPQKNWRNVAIANAYELGSVLKPLVIGACLAERVTTLEREIFCHNGAYRTPGRTLHDHHSYGTLSVAEILINSSNIGTALVAEKLGAPKLHRYLSHLGLGSQTDIYLPGESQGILKDAKRWTSSTMLSIPMGHEVTLTPLQMTAAFAALVGDGIYRPPYIVRKIVYPDGRQQNRYLKPKLTRVFPPAVVKQVRKVLRQVVTEGTAKRANIPGVKVGGKTGTAQKLVNGRYSHSKHVASFVGFAPYDDPMFCCLISVDEPQGSSYGGTVAAPYVAQILRQAILIHKGEL